MENLERDVVSYVRGVVQERLANDPMRLHAYGNLTALFKNNPGYTPSQRSAMIRNMFGDHNSDLAQMYYTLLQDECDDRLLHSTPEVRSAKLNKVAKMCWCIQFMDLFRLRFSVHAPAYTTLSNAVHLFTIDQIPESTLNIHLSQVLLHFPDFRNQLEARVNHLTSLFDIGAGNYSPAGETPPPPPPPQD